MKKIFLVEKKESKNAIQHPRNRMKYLEEKQIEIND